MPLFLVDERDGSIVAELGTAEEVQRVVEAWARDDGTVADDVSLVEVRSHRGALVGADSSVRVHPLAL